MSRLVLNHHMMKYFKILANSTHLSDYDKVIPWIASSKSSDQKHQGGSYEVVFISVLYMVSSES
jgi:hypothetical protein